MTLGPCFLPVKQSTIKYAAIAIGRTSPRYLHNVLIYRVGQEVRGLHIDISGTISSANVVDLTQQYAWAIPKLTNDDQVDERLLRQIAGYCASVGKQPQFLTYAFRFDSHSTLRPEGEHFVIAGAAGLTCSTLMLAVLRYLDIPFLNLSTWTVNETDTEWQMSLLEDMKRWRDQGRFQMTDAELEARQKEIPCARYSPAMVIGACRTNSRPSDCGTALAAGQEVVNWLGSSLQSHRPH